jgi:hypothetical protein
LPPGESHRDDGTGGRMPWTEGSVAGAAEKGRKGSTKRAFSFRRLRSE